MGTIDPRLIDPGQWRLLVADDDQGCRASLVEFFEFEGFRVAGARSGTEAITILQERPVDFSVMDIHMPGLTGIDVLKMLREDGRSLPCIFVSASASKEDKIRAIDAGAFSLVNKPVNLEVLRYSVVRLLKRYYPAKFSTRDGASGEFIPGEFRGVEPIPGEFPAEPPRRLPGDPPPGLLPGLPGESDGTGSPFEHPPGPG